MHGRLAALTRNSSFNPIKVLFLLKRGDKQELPSVAFNPIKVLFLLIFADPADDVGLYFQSYQGSIFTLT